MFPGWCLIERGKGFLISIPIPPFQSVLVITTGITDVTQTPFQTTGMGLGPKCLELSAKVRDFVIFL